MTFTLILHRPHKWLDGKWENNFELFAMFGGLQDPRYVFGPRTSFTLAAKQVDQRNASSNIIY